MSALRFLMPRQLPQWTVAESSFGQHLGCVAQSKIPEGDRAIHENEMLSRALDLAVCYDSLNIANLASFELLVRRKQLLAEAHSYSPSQPSYEGADHFLGTSYRPGGAIVVPELTKHVAERMHQESQVLKEKRKQAELKGNKGKAKPSNPQKPNPGKGGGGAASWLLELWPLVLRLVGVTKNFSPLLFVGVHDKRCSQQDFSRTKA
jgi:hypothetical protein